MTVTDIVNFLWETIVVTVIFKYIILKWVAVKISQLLGWLLKKTFIKTHGDWVVFITAYQKALKKRKIPRV